MVMTILNCSHLQLLTGLASFTAKPPSPPHHSSLRENDRGGGHQLFQPWRGGASHHLLLIGLLHYLMLILLEQGWGEGLVELLFLHCFKTKICKALVEVNQAIK